MGVAAVYTVKGINTCGIINVAKEYVFYYIEVK